jgi:hypothetical protein
VRPNSAYSIRIEAVSTMPDLVIHVLTTSAGVHCIVMPVITTPAAAVVVPRDDSQATFEESSQIQDCP